MHTFRVQNGVRVPASPAVGGACLHLGGDPRVEECGSCTERAQRRTALKVYPCAIHGECTLATRMEGVKGCCNECDDYAPRPMSSVAGSIRNLLYHVYPRRGNGVWQRNVGQLLRRIRLFNGRRVVAIATDGSTDPPEHVKDQFAGHVHEFIEARNNPSLREVGTFADLFSRVETTDPRAVTFYAQAKGVTRPVNDGVTVHPWADMLYETCLDYWPLVEATLRQFPMAGSMKKLGHGFEGSASSWHYSGAFFWFRNKDVTVRNWRRIDNHWWGIESWPGIHFRPEEAGCLFHEGRVGVLNLYSMEYLKGVAQPALDQWRVVHSSQRKEWASC